MGMSWMFPGQPALAVHVSSLLKNDASRRFEEAQHGEAVGWGAGEAQHRVNHLSLSFTDHKPVPADKLQCERGWVLSSSWLHLAQSDLQLPCYRPLCEKPSWA